jgi:toxin YoeB
MRNVQFQEHAYQEFVEWAEKDFDIFLKIDRLIKDISRDPFKGLGKPEPLKHQYKGFGQDVSIRSIGLFIVLLVN